ncbi:MAG: GIY-YIG nuclease family protein [Clostridia bacterium]|nr:GIY-YIG nuclease family protein [Clostridia bacterium]
MNYVYIVRCADGSLYTGWTNDLSKRMAAHAGRRGAKYTKAHTMQELVYYETFSDRKQAMHREWEIKQLTRKEKLLLIGQEP